MKANQRARVLYGADLFAGAGGLSRGLAEACEQLGRRVDLLAVNHWVTAVESHTANHPWARHICARVESLDPREVIPGGRLDILAAAPECVHFSVARGGRPMDDQKRASAWDLLRWLEHLRVDNVLVENVPEFRTWGPLTTQGRPVKARRGETFAAWLRAIESLGYRVEHRLLNAADYGATTSRRRLFVIARRGRKPIHWPVPTHSRDGKTILVEGQVVRTGKWRAAREVIDWSLRGESIFTRKRPLSPNTLRRIFAGIERFNPELRPFLVLLRGTGSIRDVERPVPSLTAGGEHLGLAEPVAVQVTHGARDVDLGQPLPTVTGGQRGDIGLAQPEPFLLSHASGGAPRSVEEPTPTNVAAAGPQLVQGEAFLLPPEGVHRGNAPRSPSEPLQTLTQRGGGHLVEPVIEPVPFLVGSGGPQRVGEPRSADEPLPTLLAREHFGIAQPFLVPNFGERDGQAPRTHPVTEPLPAVTSHGAGNLVAPLLVQYNGNGHAHSVEAPVPTLTTRDRLGLAMPVLQLQDGRRVALDIRFRMLQPRELAAAMGFSPEYRFTGTRTQVVRQIGNAVEVNVARALCLAILKGERTPVAPPLTGEAAELTYGIPVEQEEPTA
jgi:DNA (cytosine-5)-methyltransferase 1